MLNYYFNNDWSKPKICYPLLIGEDEVYIDYYQN